MKTLTPLQSRPVSSTFPRLLVLAVTLGLPLSALAYDSQPTFVVVSGQQVVRDGEQVCFRLDGDQGGDERLLVRVRFLGGIPRGSLAIDGESGSPFNDTTQTFAFNVSVRGVHRLTLDLRESANIEWLSLAATDSDIQQASCSSYDRDSERHASSEDGIDRGQAGGVNRFQDAATNDHATHDRLIVPTGTELEVSLDREVSTQTHRVGKQVAAHVIAPVIVNGQVALPRDTRILGSVTESQKAGRFGRARLRLAFDRAILPDGTVVPISGSVERLGKSSGGKQAAIIAGSAVGGALAGDALGVDPLIGAVVGGGIATGVIAAKPGKPVVLPANTILFVKLQANVTVPSTRNR